MPNRNEQPTLFELTAGDEFERSGARRWTRVPKCDP